MVRASTQVSGCWIYRSRNPAVRPDQGGPGRQRTLLLVLRPYPGSIDLLPPLTCRVNPDGSQHYLVLPPSPGSIDLLLHPFPCKVNPDGSQHYLVPPRLPWIYRSPTPFPCRVNPDGSQHYLVLLDTEGIDAWDQVCGGGGGRGRGHAGMREELELPNTIQEDISKYP